MGNKCIRGNYECGICDLWENCTAKRTMVDSSVIVSIIKDEPLGTNCERRLVKAKNQGKCFITHVGLGEIYEKIFDFIKKQLEEDDYNNSNLIDMDNRKKINFIEVILNGLNQIMEGINIHELTQDSLEKIEDLFKIKNLRMMGRDRTIIGIAESHHDTHHLHLDKRMDKDFIAVNKSGFKIKSEFID